MIHRRKFVPFIFIVLILGAPLLAFQDSKQQGLQMEEAEDYYKKWLNEDVVYIISEEERAVFGGLTTPEEKEQFIEQFWFRRDQDPTSASNEFKEEHYRRIAFANERFASGLPGWMTDRGRIYIIHGEPAEIESHPSGGNYERPMHEGGGSTTAFPFEVWRYRYVEGIGNDVILEFVDPTLTGEYRLALHPEEKDALLYVPGGGATLAEQLGLASKADRPWFSGARPEEYPLMYQRARDNPFIRYETYSMIQAPTPLKYKDLKEIVEVNIQFVDLPVETRKDYFRLNEDQVLVPVSIQLENKNLTFKAEGDRQVARVAVYGLITSITNRIIKEFDDDLIASYQMDVLEAGLQQKSIYQKVIPLDRKMRYKLDLVVKDLNSQKVGVVQTAIVPPAFGQEKLEGSSMILSNYIQVLDAVPNAEEMFVIGDVKVRPNLGEEFSSDSSLGIYYQVYNAGIDQTTFSPSLAVTYRLFKDGNVLLETTDESGESIQFFSGRRVVLVKQLDLAQLQLGTYKIQLEVRDRLTDQILKVDRDFKVVEPRQIALNQ